LPRSRGVETIGGRGPCRHGPRVGAGRPNALMPKPIANPWERLAGVCLLKGVHSLLNGFATASNDVDRSGMRVVLYTVQPVRA
jgi:hypothetical protein